MANPRCKWGTHRRSPPLLATLGSSGKLLRQLDGRPAQILKHSGPDSEPITKVVNEFVHVYRTPEEIAADGEEPLLIEWREVRDGNGSGGPNS